MIVTPNKMRTCRRELRQLHSDLKTAREHALTVKTTWLSNPTEAGIYDREDAVADVIEARLWYWDTRRKIESCTVQVGYAWSANALNRVRRANR